MSKLCFVTTCMGRLAHLRESLPLVVAQRDCSSVVVDYSCPEHCGDWVEASHPDVRVVRIPGQATFNRSLASNAGARAADAPWLCFFDADVCFESSFADTVLPRLVTGHYYRPHPIVDNGIVGTFICEREAFTRIGGYDEVYEGWGGRDRDLYATLQFAGAKQAEFPSALLRHIPHGNEDRTRFHDVKALSTIGNVNGLYRHIKLDIMRAIQGSLPRAQRDNLYEQVTAFVKRSTADQSATLSVGLPPSALPGGSAVRRTFQYALGSVVNKTSGPENASVVRSEVPPAPARPAETSVRALYASLTPAQRLEVCFDWNYRCPQRGLLRTFVTNHWQITRPAIRSDFFTTAQQQLIHDVFRSLLAPEWYPRFMRQLQEDTHGHPWGTDQSIALLGTPDDGPFQLVFTGRHLTLRADGNAEGRAAFGGPVMYGHAANGFTERAHHPGNVFWPQAERASQVYRLLDGAQRGLARVPRKPLETVLDFRAAGERFPGIPVSGLAPDQRSELEQVLQVLLDPFRKEDQERVRDCLREQGGLESCALAFYDEDQISGDHWDNWRLEGPAFVWYFRGTPHVHAWVHVARDSAVPITARKGPFLFVGQDPLR